MAAPPPALTSFHLFPQLPTEIRLHIWRFAPEPRVVQLWHRGRCDGSGFVSDSAEPSILHVCRESRAVGLTMYAPGFRRRQTYSPRVFPPAVYFNFDLDTAYFCKQKCCDPLWLLGDIDVFQKLRRIAIPQGIFHSVRRFRGFSQLEEIILVFEDPKFHIRGDVMLDRFPPLEPRKRYDYSQYQETYHQRLLASIRLDDRRMRMLAPDYRAPQVSIKALVGLSVDRPRVKKTDVLVRNHRRRSRWRQRRKVVGAGKARQPKQVVPKKQTEHKARPIRHPATAPYNLRSRPRRKT